MHCAQSTEFPKFLEQIKLVNAQLTTLQDAKAQELTDEISLSQHTQFFTVTVHVF